MVATARRRRRDAGGAFVNPVLLSDTFTRADNSSDIGSPEIGNPYIILDPLPGVFGVINNTAYSPTPGPGVVSDLGIANHSVELTLINPNIELIEITYIIWKAVDGNNHYFAQSHINGNLYIYKKFGGGYTEIGAIPIPGNWVGNKVLKAITSGNDHEVFLDGVSQLVFTDATFNTATKVGFGFATSSGRADNLIGKAA
jgi:hypothetical protein